jgi:hypothetical protein
MRFQMQKRSTLSKVDTHPIARDRIAFVAWLVDSIKKRLLNKKSFPVPFALALVLALILILILILVLVLVLVLEMRESKTIAQTRRKQTRFELRTFLHHRSSLCDVIRARAPLR